MIMEKMLQTNGERATMKKQPKAAKKLQAKYKAKNCKNKKKNKNKFLPCKKERDGNFEKKAHFT